MFTRRDHHALDIGKSNKPYSQYPSFLLYRPNLIYGCTKEKVMKSHYHRLLIIKEQNNINLTHDIYNYKPIPSTPFDTSSSSRFLLESATNSLHIRFATSLT